MNILGLIGQIFKPATELIDSLHTSLDEKLQAKAVLLDLQIGFMADALEYEAKQLEAKTQIILAEANSESWITRNWRPMTMLSFVAAVMAYWFGLTPDDLTPESVDAMFTLVQIGLGGYVVGRSVEKVVPGIIKAMKSKEKT